MCRCISHSPVPLKMSNVSNLRCPLTPGLPAIVISAGLVFCKTSEWNDRGAVKRKVNQHQNELKQTDQPKPTNQPTKEKNPYKTVGYKHS